MSNVIYRKIGLHRNKSRFWIEGPALSRNHYERGTRYHVDYDLERDRLVLSRVDDGMRMVSGRKKSQGTQSIQVCLRSCERFWNIPVHQNRLDL